MRSLALALLVLCVFCPTAADAQDSAPSSHMVFDDRFAGDIIVNEVRVPTSGRAMYTYYEALGWRGVGAGYAGIQVHPRAPNFIFSIWDNKAHRAPIRAVHRGPGTETERFGGEGTGLKSWNFKLGWRADVWYTLVARTWPVGEDTHFAFWSRAGDTGRWTHLVTMAVAAPGAKFEGATDAFIEDWLNTGKHPRTTHLRQGWKRKPAGEWHPFRAARYSVNYWDLEEGKRSYNFRTNWNGGVARDDSGPYYFMTAGGAKTKAKVKNPSMHKIERSEKRPAFALPEIASATAQRQDGQVVVRWAPRPAKSPQFSYTIALHDNRQGDGDPLQQTRQRVPHQREAKLRLAEDSAGPLYVRIRITDIFDQSSKWVAIEVSE